MLVQEDSCIYIYLITRGFVLITQSLCPYKHLKTMPRPPSTESPTTCTTLAFNRLIIQFESINTHTTLSFIFNHG